jgi:hypothetical protein
VIEIVDDTPRRAAPAQGRQAVATARGIALETATQIVTAEAGVEMTAIVSAIAGETTAATIVETPDVTVTVTPTTTVRGPQAAVIETDHGTAMATATAATGTTTATSVTALARIGLALPAHLPRRRRMAGVIAHRPAKTRSRLIPRSRSKTNLLSERLS